MSYLTAKEEFLQHDTRSILCTSEKDLLATYLREGRRFPSNVDVVVLDDGIWHDFVTRPEYRAKKEADRKGYVWDRIINHISEDVLQGRLEFGAELNDSERGLRVMASENRFARRLLGKALTEFFALAQRNEVRARFVKSPSDVGYVFLARPHGYRRDDRLAELRMRCFVARGQHDGISTDVGLATEQPIVGRGFSLDLVYLHLPTWTATEQARMVRMQSELGYFRHPRERRSSEEEYPTADHSEPTPTGSNAAARAGCRPVACSTGPWMSASRT